MEIPSILTALLSFSLVLSLGVELLLGRGASLKQVTA